MRWLRFGGLAGLAAAISAFTPLANVLNGWMAEQARLEPAQAIVVLARGGVDGDGVLTDASLRRTLLGVELVFSGGSAADGTGEGARSPAIAQLPPEDTPSPWARSARAWSGSCSWP